MGLSRRPGVPWDLRLPPPCSPQGRGRPPQHGSHECAAQRCRAWPGALSLSRGLPCPWARQRGGTRVAIQAVSLCVDRVLREARRTRAGPWPAQKEGFDPRCPSSAVVQAVEKNAKTLLSARLGEPCKDRTSFSKPGSLAHVGTGISSGSARRAEVLCQLQREAQLLTPNAVTMGFVQEPAE